MKITDINIPEEADEDIVQFIRHLEENLDPTQDFDCSIQMNAIRYDSVEEFPGSGITTRGPEPTASEWGVQILIQFIENEDCPSRKVGDLAESFFGYKEYILKARFDGGAGEYEGYIFENE